MAAFVERATLVVSTEGEDKLRKLNAELDKLFRKAKDLNISPARAVSKALAEVGTKAKTARREVEGIGKSDAMVKTRERTKAARDEMGRFADEAKKAGKAVRDLGVSPQTARRVRQLRDDTQATARAAEQAARARARFAEQLGRGTRTQSADQANATQTAQQIANALRNGGADGARQITDASRSIGAQGQTAAAAITQAGAGIVANGQTAAAAITQASAGIATQGQQAAAAITNAMTRNLPEVADRIAQGILTGRDPLNYTPALPPPVAPGTPHAPQPPGSRGTLAAGAVTGQLVADATREAVKQIAADANNNAREALRLMADATNAANARVAQITNQSPADARRALQAIKDNDDRQIEAKKLGNAAVNLVRSKEAAAIEQKKLDAADGKLARAIEAERIADNQLRSHTKEDRLKKKYESALEAAREKRLRAEDNVATALMKRDAAQARVEGREALLGQRASKNEANEAKRQIAAAKTAPQPAAASANVTAASHAITTQQSRSSVPAVPQAALGGGAGGIPPGGPGGAGGAGRGAGAGQGGNQGGGNGGGGGGWQPPTIREAARHMLPYFVAGGVLSAGRTTLRTAGEGITYAQDQRELTDIQNLRPDALRTIGKTMDEMGTEYRQLSRAQVLEMTRDAINAAETPEDGAAIAREMAKNAANLSLLYGSSEKGMEASRQFYRAADISGDAENADSASVFMRALTKETIRSGKDINARSVAQAVANLGAAKFGMNEQSVAGLVALSDNVRGQTSAYIRQFHEYLTSNDIKDENYAAQQKAGLRDRSGGVVDAKLFNEDKFEYVMQRVKPEVEKRLGRSLDSYTKVVNGKTVSDDAAKSGALGKVLADMGLKPSSQKLPFEYLMNEGRERKRRANYDRVNLDNAPTLVDRNLKQAGEAIKRKFQDVADAATRLDQGVIAGLGGTLASALDYLVRDKVEAQKAADAGKPTGPPAHFAATKGAAILGVAATGLAAKYIIENPDKAAMIAAGVTLSTAGASLNAAAAGLSAAAVAQRAGGLAGAAGGLAGAGGAAAAGTLLGRAAAVAFRGGVLGIGAALAYDLVRTIADGTKQDDRKPTDDATRFTDGTRSTVPNGALPELYGPPKPGSVLGEMMGPPKPQDLARRLIGDGYTSRERIDTHRMLREMDHGGQVRPGVFVDGEIARQRNRLDPPTSVPSVGLDSAAIGTSITTSVQAVAPTLTSAMSEGGNQAAPSLTAALVNGASQAGATIAAAMRDAVSNISVSVTGGGGRTGENPMAAR